MKAKIQISQPEIESKIYLLRGQKIMFDEDLAELYKVSTKRLNEQVKRNVERFPSDFMFQLSEKEFAILRSQFATSRSWGGRRNAPYAFTEHGVLMLSSVLRSRRAMKVNIQIMRTYVKIREMITNNKDILLKLELVEKEVSKHGGNIQVIFRTLKQLIEHPPEPRKKIGFKRSNE